MSSKPTRALGLLAVLLVPSAVMAAVTDVKINEIFTNQEGADTHEFIELYNTSGTPQSLDGLTVIIIEGDNGPTKGNIILNKSLTGQSIPAGAYFVLGNGAQTDFPVDLSFSTATNNIQNGTQTILLVQGYSPPPLNDVDSNNDGAPEWSSAQLGTIIDGFGTRDTTSNNDVIYYGVPEIGPDPSQDEDPGVARLCDGFDTDTSIDFFFLSNNKPLPPFTGNGTDGQPIATPGVPRLCSLVARDVLVKTDRNAGTVLVQLDATDPEPGPTDPPIYSITSGLAGVSPTSGTGGGLLLDPNNGDTDVTTGGALDGSTVTFVVGDPGLYTFSYRISDGLNSSNAATVRLAVQDPGRVVITEIMYDPNHADFTNPGGDTDFDDDWEFIEVTNLSGSEVELMTIFNGDLNTNFNLVGNLPVPAGAIRIIMEGDNGTRTKTQFVDEWNPMMTPGLVTQADLITPESGLGQIMPAMYNGGTTVYLFEITGALLDVVDYRNGEDGWPQSNNRGSIYVKAGQRTVTGNDLAANWALSQAPANGAYETPETFGSPGDSDTGSPMILNNDPTIVPPSAFDDFGNSNLVNRGAAVPLLITLQASDPDMDPLTYTIVSLPTGVAPTAGAGGTLTDPNNGNTVVSAGGMLAGNTVGFTPAPGVSGLYQFTFKVNDGTSDSRVATVYVYVQDIDTVVITEIMYDPANTPDGDWEWVEIVNLSANPVQLHSLFDGVSNTYGNIASLNISIPGNATRIITKDDIGSGRSLNHFVTEWAPLTVGSIIPLVPSRFPDLNNSSDTIRLIASDGRLLDVVSYERGSNGWPTNNGASSIFLTVGYVHTTDNDLGGNWARSLTGLEGAYSTPLPVSDVGSPAITPTGAPSAQNQLVRLNKGAAPITIDLTAIDPVPGPLDPLQYTILTAATGVAPTAGSAGTLTDPNNGNAAVILGSPLVANQVTLTPGPAATGVYAFTFRASDGVLNSAAATVTVKIQDLDRVVITEIMHDPNNEADIDWEWVEVCNRTPAPISLHTLNSTSTTAPGAAGNLVGLTIPANGCKIIAIGDNTSRTFAQFLAEWSLAGGDVWPVPSGSFPLLGNSGSTLDLIGADGSLLDVVAYGSGSPWPSTNNRGSIYATINNRN